MKQLNWSSEQLAIFNWFQIGRGNLLVEARAGSAKTTTIIEGLNRANVPSALYTVFNKRNQIEAEEKISNQKVIVKTLHGVGFGILANHWRGIKASGYTEFERIQTLYPDAEKQAIFQAARLVSYLKNTRLNPTLKEAKEAAELNDISCVKPVEAKGFTQDKLAEMAIESIKLSLEYPKNKKVSFEDLIYLPNVLGIVKPTYHLVTIDESQDLNLAQLTMATGLCLPNGKICLVGDSLQQIYGFRGALNNGMEIFQTKLNAKKLTLTTSYRCPKKIIEFVQQYAPDIKASDFAIDGEILDCKFEDISKSIKVKDAILSRTNAPLMRACLNLIKQNIPSFVLGRDIGKALWDIVESLNVTNVSEFGNALDKWLAARQPINMTPSAADKFALCQDQAATLRIVAENALTVEDIKNKINLLFKEIDDVKNPAVVCSTVHKSKGLEYPSVYVLNDTFAAGRRQLTPEQAQEERNIKYVCFTRSKNKLVIVKN